MGLSKPLIGVTGPAKGGHIAWFFTRYSIRKAGGEAIRLRTSSEVLASRIDGLVLGGGSDIHPSEYGQKPLHKQESQSLLNWAKRCLLYPLSAFTSFINQNNSYDIKRDAMEKFYIQSCIESSKPILGICRGHQLINIYDGGELAQSILDNYPENILPVTMFMRVNTKILINSIFKAQNIKVNSLHSQAVKTPGRNLIITAVEEGNEIIQATEGLLKSSKVKSVQWHPEYLFYSKTHHSLFKWLVRESQ